MISNNTIKTENPNINFCYEDIITYLKKQNTILELPKNSRKIYKQIIKNVYKHYIKIGQSHHIGQWNQYSPQIQWNDLWKNTLYSYNWLENNNILYLLLHLATRANDQINGPNRWTNQKHLTSTNCKETNPKTNNHNTNPHMENKKQTTISRYNIPATNVIINIKNELKNVILTHYKHHTINNTLHEFQSNFCINNALYKLTQNSITMLF